ncbi:MAG: hypothetical protein HDT28_04875 [Clostridiales bacterium]|nr:hypothetical protein [Clostridiales bacterium]
MKTRAKTHLVSRERAIQIASNHNGVSIEVASRYSDSELKEVLLHASGRTFKLKANF